MQRGTCSASDRWSERQGDRGAGGVAGAARTLDRHAGLDQGVHVAVDRGGAEGPAGGQVLGAVQAPVREARSMSAWHDDRCGAGDSGPCFAHS